WPRDWSSDVCSSDLASWHHGGNARRLAIRVHALIVQKRAPRAVVAHVRADREWPVDVRCRRDAMTRDVLELLIGPDVAHTRERVGHRRSHVFPPSTFRLELGAHVAAPADVAVRERPGVEDEPKPSSSALSQRRAPERRTRGIGSQDDDANTPARKRWPAVSLFRAPMSPLALTLR